MGTLQENLNSLLKEARLSVTDLAKHTGIKQPVIYRITIGETTNPNVQTLSPIANYFKVSISQLIGDEPLPNKRINNQSGDLAQVNTIPVYLWKDRLSEFLQSKIKLTPKSYIVSDALLTNTKNAFAIEVKDTSLEPTFSKGSIFVIDPEKLPNNKDYVIVHIAGEQQNLIKQIIIEGQEIYFKSIIPDLSNLEPRKKQAGDRVLGVMVQAKINYG